MSSRTEENLTHIDRVDVDSSEQENSFISEITNDSGVDTGGSCSSALPTSGHHEAYPVEASENDTQVDGQDVDNKVSDHGSSTSLSSPTSVSPDNNDATENLLSIDDFSLIKVDLLSEIDHISLTKDDLDKHISNNEVHITDDSTIDSIDDLESCKPKIDAEIGIPESKLNHEICSILTTSTLSLNEQNTFSTDKNILCKSPYSRSAENITTIDQNQKDSALNTSTKELNAEKILSQFASQKNKASATQTIPGSQKQLDTEQKHLETQAVDIRYTRIPKELLSQDLGSIVKNVHGIFSSVSGSLKNAYTYRTVQKPVKSIVKPIPNSKVMDDIFEDENRIDNLNTTLVNGNKGIHHEELHQGVQEIEYEKQSDRDTLRLHMETLERVLSEQRKENSSLRDRVKQQGDEIQEKDQTFKELEVKLDLMGKRVELAEREKDAAVMRYASVECTAIEAKRAAEKATAAERAAVNEMELLNNKLKSAHSEKQRICHMYDDKCHELQVLERELGKVREDTKELEGRLKWTQSKLRMEMEAYKESAERAEKLSQQLAELEAAKEAAATNSTDSAKAKQLEAELKASRADLILCRHEREELERRLTTAAAQLEACRRDRDGASSELARTTAEVDRLKVSNLRLEEEAAELAALRAQAALADTLSAQLTRESERAAQAEECLSRERARAETCARREASALEHAARLTAQHVAHRAAAGEHEAKAQALSVDNSSLRERVCALEGECGALRDALAEETDRRHKENRTLARKVAEMAEEVADASKKLEWEKGENSVLKKKHASAIKELNRELQRALKRCEQLEAKLPPPDAASNRTGSVSSLSSGESASPDDRIHSLQNGHTDPLPDIQVREPDRQALIERIVSLQRAAARRSERCEFLEEHSKQLTGELRAKSRLLRQLLCTMPAGAVTSRDSDEHKKEIARLGGGAMAAVWGGDPAGMTLELSLEMNRRLQAVLEDALLKNITLKENMDTLGEEISRLKEQKNSAESKS